MTYSEAKRLIQEQEDRFDKIVSKYYPTPGQQQQYYQTIERFPSGGQSTPDNDAVARHVAKRRIAHLRREAGIPTR